MVLIKRNRIVSILKSRPCIKMRLAFKKGKQLVGKAALLEEGKWKSFDFSKLLYFSFDGCKQEPASIVCLIIDCPSPFHFPSRFLYLPARFQESEIF